jgi:hypothetical protein
MKRAYISCRAYSETKQCLYDIGFTVIELPESSYPYPAVSSHPDMYMCAANNRIIMPENPKSRHYLAQNGVFLDEYFIHNLKYTAPEILSEAKAQGLELINVKQGYTKCSCAVIDGRSIITADKGIISALYRKNIDVLEIEAGHVLLDGFEYGFIGGACGRVQGCMMFNGDLSSHPDGDRIREFVKSRGIEIFEVKNKPLYDIGTIFAE